MTPMHQNQMESEQYVTVFTLSVVTLHSHPIMTNNTPGLAHIHYPLIAPILIYVLEVIHLHCYPNFNFHPLDQIVHHYKVLFLTGISIRASLFTVRHRTNQIIYHPVSHQTNQIIHH